MLFLERNLGQSFSSKRDQDLGGRGWGMGQVHSVYLLSGGLSAQATPYLAGH